MEESRTAAVGRKRKAPTKNLDSRSHKRRSSKTGSNQNGVPDQNGAPAAKPTPGAAKERKRLLRQERKQRKATRSRDPEQCTAKDIDNPDIRSLAASIEAANPGWGLRHILTSIHESSSHGRDFRRGALNSMRKLNLISKKSHEELKAKSKSFPRAGDSRTNKDASRSGPSYLHPAMAADSEQMPGDKASVGSPERRQSPGSEYSDGTMDESDGDDNEDAASVGEVPVNPTSSSHPLTTSSSSHASNPNAPPPPQFNSANTVDLRLYEIPLDQQDLQKKYFGLVDPGAVVYCLSCGRPGHLQTSCPLRLCPHCDLRDAHLPQFCPRVRKCPRCRRPGHTAPVCPNPTKPLTSADDACAICDYVGHVEETCPYLGRVRPLDPQTTLRIPRRQMIVACYSCGSDRHWGDDCPSRDGRDAEMASRGVHEWSAAYAENFILPDEHATDGSRNDAVGNMKGDAGRDADRGNGIPRYQLAQLGDWD